MWFEQDFKKYYIWKYHCSNDKDSLGKYRLAIRITKYKRNDYYSGKIFYYNDLGTCFHISGNDIDLVKLKCLLVAKDMGWIIKNIV